MTDEPNPPESVKPTVDRIREGAAELFRERGYSGTTTRALSAVAGIEKASLYHHVGGKEDLLYELCESTLKDVATVFQGALQDGTEPLDKLELLARRYVETALVDRARHATMLTEIRSLSPSRRAEIVARRDENVAVVREAIRQAQESGSLRTDIEAKYLTLALFNLLNWSIFWFDPSGDLEPNEIGDILWTVYAHGAVRADSPAGQGRDSHAQSAT
jgi:TetR/AcrR family transcriptional regulator, cholesterol catabolism regulator